MKQIFKILKKFSINKYWFSLFLPFTNDTGGWSINWEKDFE